MNDDIDKMIEESLEDPSKEDEYYFNNSYELCVKDDKIIEEKFNEDICKTIIKNRKFNFIRKIFKIPVIICLIFILLKGILLFFENNPQLIFLSPMLIVFALAIFWCTHDNIKPILKTRRCTIPIVCEVTGSSVRKEAYYDNGPPIDILYISFQYFYNGKRYSNYKMIPGSTSKPLLNSKIYIKINPYNPIEYIDDNGYEYHIPIKEFISNIIFILIPFSIVLGPLIYFALS